MWTSCASLLRHLATPLLRLTDRGQADMTTLLNSSCNFSYGRNINCVIAVVTTTALLRSAGGQTCRLQLELRDFRKDSTTRIAAGSKNRWHKAKLKREHKYDVCVVSVSHTLCSYTHTNSVYCLGCPDCVYASRHASSRGQHFLRSISMQGCNDTSLRCF
jgi:hypothetical protein